MPEKKSILLIIDNHLSRAPRAQTMIRALKHDYCVTVAALGPDHEEGYVFEKLITKEERKKDFHFSYPWPIKKSISAFFRTKEKISSFFPSSYYESKIWDNTNKARYNQFKGRKFDAIICHHAHNLPLGARLAEKIGAKLFFNAHEYYPREFDDNAQWLKYGQPFVHHIFDKYAQSISFCFAAAEGYADAYSKNYSISCDVIPCVKPYSSLKPQSINGVTKIVHQGYANPDRKIEKMIEMCGYLDNRFQLHLYLLSTNDTYFNELKVLASQYKNVFFLPPVEPDALVSTLNNYDIGLYILPPSNFNTTYMVPNKIFEFVQARLMTAISPAEGMIPYVKEHNIGIIAPDHQPKSMAESLNAITAEEIIKYKMNADAAAYEMAAESYYPLIKNKIAKFLN